MIRLNATTGIPARYANRHALIAGPTGTGKTVTLQKLTESLAQAGVSVFAPDIKGDFAALARSCETRFLQPLTGPGQPCRVPVWAMGADLLSRALELSEAQAGALEIAFRHADDTGAPLDTLGDFRALLSAMSADTESVAHLGYVTRASIGTIQRALLRLESQGAADLFGAPGFDVADLLSPGLVSILDASALYHSPRLYGALMLYLLRDLARRLPELGDMDKPRLALVIDEAHCLFHEASPALLRSIEATARLIRSKGVGLYFASQSPADIPPVVREQCATRIEHAREYGVGNALFASLDNQGKPTAPRMIRPDLPQAPLGALSPEESAQYMQAPAESARAQAPGPGPEPERLNTHGFIFLGVMGAALLGLLAAIGAGYGPAIIAVSFGAWLALR